MLKLDLDIKFTNLLLKKYDLFQMNINATDLLPMPPDITTRSKLSCYTIFKNALFCIVILGGLYIIMDKVTDQFELYTKRQLKYNQCEDVEDILETQKFQECKLNSESDSNNELKLDLTTLNLMKNDISSLKSQVMALWNLNEGSSKCNSPEIEDKIKTAISESNAVDDKIKKALYTYDADKLALYDYAAEYAGGEIVSIPDTTPYPKNKILHIFGFFRLSSSSLPKEMIQPSTVPGDCFQFYGDKAKIVIRLGKKISIGSITMEYSPLVEDCSDAPKQFRVFGLDDPDDNKKSPLGVFEFSIEEQKSMQNFPISTSPFRNNFFEYVMLEILNNHGNKHYTSIYRFRVHAGKN